MSPFNFKVLYEVNDKNNRRLICLIGFISFMLTYCTAYHYINESRNKIIQSYKFQRIVVKNNLLYSIQQMASSYTKKKGKPPEKFSDFLDFKRDPTDQEYILVIKNDKREAKMKHITNVKGLNSKYLQLYFFAGGIAHYYLNGSDVTSNDRDLKDNIY